MIDTIYQAGTDQAIDDRMRRTTAMPPAEPATLAGFWRSIGGVPAGILDAAGSAVDLQTGVARLEASEGLVYNPATHTYTQLPIDDSARKLQEQIALRGSGSLFTSDTGDQLRAKAKDFMPDPQTTGRATQLTAGVLHFATEAIPAAAAGGPVLGPASVGVLTGMQEADTLRAEGVDQRTRMQAGTAAGVGGALSMVLPMTGATALIRAGKGAVGGVAATSGQAEAERLILAHAGYDKLADQYDPLDPVSLALGAVVPAAFGAAFGHPVRTEKDMKAAATLTPAEQAHAAEFESSAGNLAELRQAIVDQKDPAAKAELQKELARLEGERTIRAGAEDPDIVAAARVNQAADAIDASRLTPDEDLAGRDLHTLAVETASDQIARGEPVAVDDLMQTGEGVQAERTAAVVKALNEVAALRQPAANDAPPAQLAAPQSAASTALLRPEPVAAPAVAEPSIRESSPQELAVAKIAADHPDLMVHLDGMEKAVPIGDLLAAVREAADGEIRDSRLIEVAAQCAISS